MPQAPTLFDLKVDGKVVHALDQPTKTGLNFVLNRDTGKPIIPAPETKVSDTASQPGDSKTSRFQKAIGSPHRARSARPG